MRYITVAADSVESLSTMVEEYIAAGYIPQGGICYRKGWKLCFLQAMYRPETP